MLHFYLPSFIIIFQRLQPQITIRILHQNLDSAFCIREAFPALARQLHTLFEKFQALVERQVALFKLLYDPL